MMTDQYTHDDAELDRLRAENEELRRELVQARDWQWRDADALSDEREARDRAEESARRWEAGCRSMEDNANGLRAAVREVQAALLNGADDELWPPGMTAAQAGERLRDLRAAMRPVVDDARRLVGMWHARGETLVAGTVEHDLAQSLAATYPEAAVLVEEATPPSPETVEAWRAEHPRCDRCKHPMLPGEHHGPPDCLGAWPNEHPVMAAAEDEIRQFFCDRPRDTPERAQFWDTVEKAEARVATLPDWAFGKLGPPVCSVCGVRQGVDAQKRPVVSENGEPRCVAHQAVVRAVTRRMA